MKKALALVAALMFAQNMYASENLEIDANYRVRMSYDTNADGADGPTDYHASQRFMFGGTWRPSDKITGRLNMSFNDILGADHNFDRPSELVHLVEEAYMKWMVTEDMSISFGRQEFIVADGTIFGGNHWGNHATVHDGLVLSYDTDFVKVNAFHFIKDGNDGQVGYIGNYTNPTAPTAIQAGEEDAIINGLSVDVVGLPEMFTLANFTVFNHFDDTTANINTAAENHLNYSLSVGMFFADMLGFRTTYAMQTGEQTSAIDFEASMLDAEFYLTMEEVMGLRASIGYHTDSGDDAATTDKNEKYNRYFAERHGNAGLMDTVIWGNLTDISVKVSMMPMDSLKVGLEYHMFTRTEKTDTSLGGGAATEDDLGSEIDLYATHKYDGGLTLTSRVSMFTPGDAWSATNDETHTQLYFQAAADF